MTAVNALRKLGRAPGTGAGRLRVGVGPAQVLEEDLRVGVALVAQQQPAAGAGAGGRGALDVGAAADAAVEDPLGGQVGQRLAQRLSVDVEPLGQRPLARQLAGQLARRDRRPQLLAEPLKLVARLRRPPLRGPRARGSNGAVGGVVRRIHTDLGWLENSPLPSLAVRPAHQTHKSPDPLPSFNGVTAAYQTYIAGKGGSPSIFVSACFQVFVN
jgi:hypothetical protein